jgi:hypothetical protein
MLAVSIVALFSLVALGIDLGMLAVARSESQHAADAGALAGCRILNNKPTAVENDKAQAMTTAREVVRQNLFHNANFTESQIQSVRVRRYDYDLNTESFRMYDDRPPGKSWSAVEVTIGTEQPSFFARVMGVTGMPVQARALAAHRPRDVALVLDYTGSMGYGSTLNWPYSGTTQGLMNPDPAYPKFGHYARYTYYQNTNPSTSRVTSSTVANRPNPMQMKGYNGDYAPNNVTMETGGGPPIVEDFLTAPNDPASVDASTAFQNAFKMWTPALVTRAQTSTLTPAVYSYAGYDAFSAACPAPDNFDDQSDTPVPYVGDKWPRKDGTRGGGAQPWSTVSGSSFTDNGAQTLSQFLYGTTDPPYTGSSGRALLSGLYALPVSEAGYGHPTGQTDGGRSRGEFRDAIWEAYGYDLDVKKLRDDEAGGSVPVAVKLLPAAERFKGYSMGPGYWGKTFFTWPPDPRWGGGTGTPDPTRPSATNPAKDVNGNWICDWRRRFFLYGNGTPFDPQSQNVNAILLENSAGHVLNAVSASAGSAGYYRINYAAVMAWLKSGPQTLPTNLRAGRILYYSTMPDDLTNSAPGNADDKMFWRHYIHYCLGVDQFMSSAPIQNWSYAPNQMLAGIESNFPFGSLSQSGTSNARLGGETKPRPYMAYTDNVNRPRAHFWFGPLSMVNFLERKGEDRPWWAGTVRETQCWQLKAAMNSALDDIRNNHPNDLVGEAFYATRGSSTHFTKPMCPMGQDWFSLKNVLFFRNDTVAALKANPGDPIEHRPYSSTFAGTTGSSTTEKIPNGQGSTDPITGLAVAFNLLSHSTTLSAADYGTRARKGAAKIVIFETDGIPNTDRSWSITGSGENTRYINSGSIQRWNGDSSLNQYARAAVAVVSRITAPVSTGGTSGYSTPNTPARVYAIAFGDLFDGYPDMSQISGTGQDALQFLLRVQQVGNTSPPGNPPTVGLPPEQVITGPYQRPDPTMPEDPVSNPPGRIEKLRSALERIMQSGVQVTLLE